MVLLVIGLFEFCNHGLCTCNLVSYLDFYFGAERQEHIGSGAELDEAYLLSGLEWLFVFSVADHAPCKEAGDLTAEHFRAVFIAEYDCGPLVLGGGLGMPCSEVVASVVTEKEMIPVTGAQLTWTLKKDMNTEIWSLRSWKYSGSSTSCMMTTVPSAGAVILCASPAGVRFGLRKST